MRRATGGTASENFQPHEIEPCAGTRIAVAGRGDAPAHDTLLRSLILMMAEITSQRTATVDVQRRGLRVGSILQFQQRPPPMNWRIDDHNRAFAWHHARRQADLDRAVIDSPDEQVETWACR